MKSGATSRTVHVSVDFDFHNVFMWRRHANFRRRGGWGTERALPSQQPSESFDLGKSHLKVAAISLWTGSDEEGRESKE